MDNTLDMNSLSERVKTLEKMNSFTARKLTDTPTDALAIVNLKFVTANGLTAARPPVPVRGQRFFDTTLNKPIWYGNSNIWVDATGTPA